MPYGSSKLIPTQLNLPYDYPMVVEIDSAHLPKLSGPFQP